MLLQVVVDAFTQLLIVAFLQAEEEVDDDDKDVWVAPQHGCHPGSYGDLA